MARAMPGEDLQLLVFLVAAGIVTVAAFCRLSLTTGRTAPGIRFGIWLLGTLGAVALAAPLTGWRPDLLHTATFAALAHLQLATRRLWAGGVPPEYLTAPPRGRER